MNLSDDDANSTQLEGKILKGRGVKEDGYQLAGRLVEIDVDSPDVGEREEEIELEIQHIQGRESKLERDERLKREALTAQRQGVDQQKKGAVGKDPGLVLDALEDGLILSRTKGKPVNKQHFKSDPNADYSNHKHHGHHPEHAGKVEQSLVSAMFGTVLELPAEVKIAEKGEAPKGSIAATKVEDVRGKEGLGVSVGI